MTVKEKFRTRFNRYPRVQFSAPDNPLEERRTKQEMKDECDINLIMARYNKTGVLPPSAREAFARYGDFTDVPSYQEMYDRVLAAEEGFASLPSHVRAKFNNDPGEFIASVETDEGQKLFVELGLAKPKQDPQAKPEGMQGSGGARPPVNSMSKTPDASKKTPKPTEQVDNSE